MNGILFSRPWRHLQIFRACLFLRIFPCSTPLTYIPALPSAYFLFLALLAYFPALCWTDKFFFGACSAYKIFPPMAPYMFSYISTLRTVNTFSRTWHYLHVFTTLGTAYFFSARLTLLTYFLASGTIYMFISGSHHVSLTPQYCLSSHFRSSGVAQIMKTE